MDYCELAKGIHNLISKEIDFLENNPDLAKDSYPEILLSYEFFRYLRGEFFHHSKPDGLDCQKDLYDMENNIKEKINHLKNKLDIDNEDVQYSLEQAKKIFE